MIKCPYKDCVFEGEDQDDVDDHLEYMLMVDDDEHTVKDLR